MNNLRVYIIGQTNLKFTIPVETTKDAIKIIRILKDYNNFNSTQAVYGLEQLYGNGEWAEFYDSYYEGDIDELIRQDDDKIAWQEEYYRKKYGDRK
jgi:hypothetical protein